MTRTAPDLPPWERELRAAAKSKDGTIRPFVTAPFVGSLKTAVGSGNSEDLRARLRAARLRVDKQLEGDRRYDELRARIAAAFVLWRVDDDRMITDRDFEAGKKPDRVKRVTVETRTFRQALAYQRYRDAISGADPSSSELENGDVEKGANLETRGGWCDALVALLYSIIDRSSITHRWDPTTNTLRCRDEASAANTVLSTDTGLGKSARDLKTTPSSEDEGAVDKSRRTMIVAGARETHVTSEPREQAPLPVGTADPVDEATFRDLEEDCVSPVTKMGAAVSLDEYEDAQPPTHQSSGAGASFSRRPSLPASPKSPDEPLKGQNAVHIEEHDDVDRKAADASKAGRFIDRLERIIHSLVLDHAYGAAKNDDEAMARIDALNDQISQNRRRLHTLDLRMEILLRAVLLRRIDLRAYRHKRQALTAQRALGKSELRILLKDRKLLREHGASVHFVRPRRTIRQRVGYVAPISTALAIVAIACCVVAIELHEQDKENFFTVTDIDPLTAAATVGYWSPGWGPDRKPRPDGDTTPRFVDPEVSPIFLSPSGKDRYFGPLLSGESTYEATFIRIVGGEYDASNHLTRLSAGEYPIEIAIANEATAISGESIVGARVNLGLLPATPSGYDAVYARLSASNAETVWSGIKVASCYDCRVKIDSSSVRWSSDDHEEPAALSGEIFDVQGALIGAFEPDGVIPAGHSPIVTVTATLVVTPRVPGDHSAPSPSPSTSG